MRGRDLDFRASDRNTVRQLETGQGTAAALAPQAVLVVVPSVVAEMLHLTPMGPAAGLAPSLGAREADEGGECGPSIG